MNLGYFVCYCSYMEHKIEIEEITCADRVCGVTFYVTNGFEKRRRSDHNKFFCPNGHSLSYPGETEETVLKGKVRDRDLRIEELQREVVKRDRLLKKVNRKPRAKK